MGSFLIERKFFVPRRLGLCLLALVLGGGMLAAVYGKDAGAEEYSAYSDPDKTALSLILSEPRNVREFEQEFGLDDAEVGKVLAAVREENEKLAEEYAASEKIVAANKSLPDEKVADRISASDYDETVEGAIGETKESVTDLLPRGGEPELRAWVDEQWAQEVSSSSEESYARVEETKAGRRVVCKVFATQYIGYTRYEASLPHRTLKFGSRPQVVIKRINGNVAVRPRIKEVGPWNTYDNYWQTRKNRTMWKSLKRCVPQAHAAYYRNYNGGKDEFGRTVLNPAGVDLTPAVASDLRLGKYQNAWVYVKFPWLRR
ncbi:hypothetical protein GBA63_08185 [Rubrobacter tropicus]|uniref:Uncharacterized protein n=1 Tax=Rubrobacter tropicus TaxID=2653851 RepID=A0A6G8Q863_9ACTN|nr:hypothetical protein [Rubrobacter tropicus]QIN82622.1 hypothetical protein GBA63_08185 [Rubrobacter tropicus]